MLESLKEKERRDRERERERERERDMAGWLIINIE